MKKVVILMVTAMTIMSCNKEEIDNPDCKCGIVVDTWENQMQTPFMNIENDCSGNTFKENNFEDRQEGDKVCLGFEW